MIAALACCSPTVFIQILISYNAQRMNSVAKNEAELKQVLNEPISLSTDD